MIDVFSLLLHEFKYLAIFRFLMERTSLIFIQSVFTFCPILQAKINGLITGIFPYRRLVNEKLETVSFARSVISLALASWP